MVGSGVSRNTHICKSSHDLTPLPVILAEGPDHAMLSLLLLPLSSHPTNRFLSLKLTSVNLILQYLINEHRGDSVCGGAVSPWIFRACNHIIYVMTTCGSHGLAVVNSWVSSQFGTWTKGTVLWWHVLSSYGEKWKQETGLSLSLTLETSALTQGMSCHIPLAKASHTARPVMGRCVLPPQTQCQSHAREQGCVILLQSKKWRFGNNVRQMDNKFESSRHYTNTW